MAVSSNKLSELLLINSPIQPEEDITGFQCRTLDYRVTNSRERLLEFLGCTSGRLAWAFPSRLHQIHEQLQPLLPMFETVIFQHTRYPLFAPFLSTKGQRGLYSHHHGRARKNIAQLTGVTTANYRGRLGMCVKCVEADFNSRGFPFWRRSHFVPGASFCIEHAEPLVTFCQSCELGHRRHKESVVPSLTCLCGKSLQPIRKLKSSKAAESLMSVEGMASQLLTGRVEISLGDGLLPVLTERRLIRGGLEGRRGVLATLTDVLHECLGTEALSELGIKPHTIERLIGRGPETECLRNPLLNIAAAYAVFGGWDALSDEASLHVADPDSYCRSTTRPRLRERSDWGHLSVMERIEYYQQLDRRQLESKRKAARGWLLEALKTNRRLTRTELRRRDGGGGHYEFLVHMDAAWLKKKIPSKNPGEMTKVLVRLRGAVRGKQLVRHIRAQRERLRRDHPNRRITRASLLNNSTCQSTPGHAEQFDGVAEALAECIDTDYAYDQRRIRHLVKAIRACGIKTHYADYATWRLLTRQQLKSRLWRARKWLRKHAK